LFSPRPSLSSFSLSTHFFFRSFRKSGTVFVPLLRFTPLINRWVNRRFMIGWSILDFLARQACAHQQTPLQE
jgi:hypothetical protein